ncbi:MAG: hypothetical protein JWN71_532 [Xanthobacteraceae bacterium]|nr:hypothetical protein [Xanthobacteraceae bacterium]
MTIVLLKNAPWIYTSNPADPLIKNGHVVVQSGRIAQIGRGDAPVIAGADEIDCSGCIVLPGFINLHHHFFQALTRALPGAHRAASSEWLVRHYPVWSEINADDLAAAVRNAAAELVLSGATTSADHAFILGGAGSQLPEAEVTAAAEIGLRLHLVRACLPNIGGDVEVRLRKLMGERLDALITPESGLVAQCRADVERWHDASHGSMLRMALGPSNLPYTKPQLLSDFAKIADETGCGLHAHYHPRQAERAQCRTLLGCEPIDFLERSGWLRPGAWFAHCTELDDGEIERFAATATGVAHCPRTVLRLGYHVPRIARMRASGTPVGVGVDGAASNDGGAFISDLRLALLLHRCREQHPLEGEQTWLTPEDALRMATSDAAAILGRDDIGSLRVGMCADLTAFNLSGVEYAGSLNDPLGGFLLAGVSARAATTIINGRVVVRDGTLATANEQALARATNAASMALLARTAVHLDQSS